MPELPEVETIRLQLSQYIPGLKIEEIEVVQRKSFIGDEKQFKGVIIGKLKRLGKMIFIDTDCEADLVIHLKMTGQLIFQKSDFRNQISVNKLPNKYTRVIINFTEGSRLYFNDLRRFGWIKVMRLTELQEKLKKIGPDPLKISRDVFCQILLNSKNPVKLTLMDQEKLSGVGNIYANESLFLAKINPRLASNKINKAKANLLLNSLQKTLAKGIKWGGASDNNYLNAFGEKGEMQEHFLVYGKEGEHCINKCGGKIIRIKQGGRSSFFCPTCQKSVIIGKTDG